MLILYKNSLAIGKVWHKRYFPKIHDFSYKLNMWLIDLDHTDNVNKNLNLFYKFRDRDYLANLQELKLKNRVLSKFYECGINLDNDSKIFLLGQVSNLGTYFSPLNLFLIYNAENKLIYILAEVSNTPWNERHYYILNQADKIITHDKQFHVSPFFSMNQIYTWGFKILTNSIYFKIDIIEKDKKVFTASFNSSLITLENAKQRRVFLKNPFNGLKIIIGIYFEALRLFIKKLKFYKHPIC